MTIEQKRFNRLLKLEDAYLDADWAVMDDPHNEYWRYKAHEAAVKLDKFCKKYGFKCIARDDSVELADYNHWTNRGVGNGATHIFCTINAPRIIG